MTDFKRETECVYKDEHYSVRDNGAVLRHARKEKRLRKYDNQWTFGKPNSKTGYMEIASVRIHRIVATAFYGKPPTKEHVIDHIDTNKRNNRPENLRWVTRLENVLLNPITVKRIELVCGCNIEEFLADPSKFRDKFQEPNYKWMTTVSKEEAQASREKLLAWAESDKLTSGGSLGEWIFSRSTQKQYVDEAPEFTTSLTPNAKQKDWKTPTEFPLCPKESMNDSVETYEANLKIGEIFSRNQYSQTIIYNFALSKDGNSLLVMCQAGEDNAVKPWLLAQITYENSFFVHTNLGSFFERVGADKKFTLAQGFEWVGSDSIDDYC